MVKCSVCDSGDVVSIVKTQNEDVMVGMGGNKKYTIYEFRCKKCLNEMKEKQAQKKDKPLITY